MDELPVLAARPRGAPRGVLIGILAMLLLFTGVWITGSTRSSGEQLAVAPSGSMPPVHPTTVPTRRPVVASVQIPPSREVELFAHELRLTIPGGNYSDGRNQATIVGPSMRIEIERWAAGPLHTISRGIPGSVSGSTLDEVAASLESLLSSDGATYTRRTRTLDDHEAVEWVASQPIPTDGRPFVVLLVMDDSMAYLVEAFTAEPGLTGIALARFASLESSINFLTPSDIVVLGGRVSLTLPGAMRVVESTSTVLAIDTESSFLGIAPGLSIHRVPLGTPTEVLLPNGDEGDAATVDGRRLRDVATSIERSNDVGLREGIRRSITLDGHRGHQWTYGVDLPWSDVFGPVHVTVRVFVVGRNAFVLVGSDDTLIRSIRFLR